LDDASAASTQAVVPFPTVRRTVDDTDNIGRYSVTSYRYPRLFPAIAGRISLPHHQRTTRTVRLIT